MQAIDRLRNKLYRELAQAEWDARLHTRREAHRLGDVPPARALLWIAEHAEVMAPELAAIIERDQPLGARAGRAVGTLFSTIRYFFIDRLWSNERSYRATLLGLRHGIDALHLTRDVAILAGQWDLVALCDREIPERETLVEAAQTQLAWFAGHADSAMRAGMFGVIAGDRPPPEPRPHA